MTQKNQSAIQKMQQIANRLISNTPQLVKMLDNDSLLKPKRPSSPNNKKNKSNNIGFSNQLSFSKNQMSANDYHQKCKQLTNQLMSQKDKCQQLQQQITIIKQRFVQRQIQYRKIIQELQDQLKSKSSLDNTDRNRMQNIQQLHKEIIDNISSIQNKTSKILIQQQSDLRRFFHKRIAQIKDKFKQDKINKTQKDQQYQQKQKQMMSQLEWIKNIAHKIDQENQQIIKKYTTLKTQFDIQEKDKEILLKQLLMKKKQNAVLKSQVQQYEKLLNQVSKEMQAEQNQKSNIQGVNFNLNDSQSSTSNKLLNNNNNNLSSNKKAAINIINNNIINSRTSIPAKQSRLKDQKFTAININNSNINGSNINQDKKSGSTTISHLKSIISKQKKRVRDLKNLYMRQIGTKSQLESIIRKLVDDVRESIVQVQKQRRKLKKSSTNTHEQTLSIQAREQMLEKLLTNQKILTLIYDKTFYSGQKNKNNQYQQFANNMMVEEIPEEIQQILQDDDEEGFA